VVEMLAAAAGPGGRLRLVHVHRSETTFAAPPAVPLTLDKVLANRALLRWEGHMAVRAAAAPPQGGVQAPRPFAPAAALRAPLRAH
jgi:hypothetical protein